MHHSLNNVDIYLFCLDQLPIEFYSVDTLSVLTQLERQSLASIKSSRRYREYLAGHLLTRLLLGKITGENWTAITLYSDANGKPYAKANLSLPAFNLSHAGNWLAIAVTTSGRLGIDIEVSGANPIPDSELLEIARRNYSDCEYRDLRTLPLHEKSFHFYRMWTIKEAVIKAIGYGLGLCPLKNIRTNLVENRGTYQLNFSDQYFLAENEYVYLENINCHLSIAREDCLGRVNISDCAKDNLDYVWGSETKSTRVCF